MRPLLDQALLAPLPPERERLLQEHLPLCLECQAYLHHRQQAASPPPPSAPPKDTRARRFAETLLVFALVLGGIGALALFPEEPDQTELQIEELRRAAALRAREAEQLPGREHVPSDTAQVLVYRRTLDGKSVPVELEIRAEDALSFAYDNRRGWTRLLIFAEDERGTVYWYHPHSTDPDADPGAIPIQSTDKRVELPETITHTYQGSFLSLTAIFLNRSVTTREVETLLAVPREAGEPLIPDSQEQLFLIRVTRSE
jgi:hypothetical protein